VKNNSKQVPILWLSLIFSITTLVYACVLTTILFNATLTIAVIVGNCNITRYYVMSKTTPNTRITVHDKVPSIHNGF
jgi:hypothetical protein